MNPTSVVLRWYRQSTGGARPADRPYTAEEVLRLLRAAEPVPEADGADRAAPVRDAASMPSAWLARLSKQQREELGELAGRLPSIVFHHVVGGDPADLVRRFGGWGPWRYERALEIAGACIAAHLNQAARINQ